jgi:hypothetical protein
MTEIKVHTIQAQIKAPCRACPTGQVARSFRIPLPQALSLQSPFTGAITTHTHFTDNIVRVAELSIPLI